MYLLRTFSCRIALVTGANRGIGFEISKQLASNGVKVILTARDVKRGNEAVENLNAAGYSDVIFHQLDLEDSASISTLVDFITNQFGKLDILVNATYIKKLIKIFTNYIIDVSSKPNFCIKIGNNFTIFPLWNYMLNF